MSLLAPLAIAVVTFFVMHREALVLRIVGAVMAFFFPFVAVIGWLFYGRIRPRLQQFGDRVQQAARAQAGAVQAQVHGHAGRVEDPLRALLEAGKSSARRAGSAGMQVDARLQSATPDSLRALLDAGRSKASTAPQAVASSGGKPAVATPGRLDLSRLLSPDIEVRFGAPVEGGRKLNIPKVVE